MPIPVPRDVSSLHADSEPAPYLTADLPGIGGLLKVRPEDFEVEEIPAYAPCGDGAHLFLWIEKTGISAEQLTQHLARILQISQRAIGMAGLKDRQAVTRQFVSIPADCRPRLPDIDTAEIRVLEAQLHRNKLRTGHLKGNRFTILVRDVDAAAKERAHEIQARIEATGFPNFFGDQRFGAGGETLKTGFAALRSNRNDDRAPWKGNPPRRFLRRFSLSAVQSYLFNRALTERMSDGLLHRVLPGDVMQVAVSRGPFVVDDPVREQRRFDERETVITGPIFGPKMKRPAGEPLKRELQLLEQFDLQIEDFAKAGKLALGTRRPYLIWAHDLSIEEKQDGLRFAFSLPKGVYATTLLREFMKTGD